MFRVLLTAVLLAGACGFAGADPLNGADNDLACARIAVLIDDSVSLGLAPRIERAFTLTLSAASSAAHHGQNVRALTLLRTFRSEVRGVVRAKRLRADAAQTLIAQVEETIAVLSMSTDTEDRTAKNE